MCFTDLILEVLHNDNPHYTILSNDNVIFNGDEYNLIQDGKSSEKQDDGSKKTVLGLEQLDKINQVHWNTENIISFLKRTPTIQTIYFTRKPTGVWGRELNEIKYHSCMQGRSLTNIYTPSGQSLKGTPRMNALLRHWIFNKDKKFGALNNNWLIQHGVTLQNFKLRLTMPAPNKRFCAIAADGTQHQLFVRCSPSVSADPTQMSSRNKHQLLYIFQQQFGA